MNRRDLIARTMAFLGAALWPFKARAAEPKEDGWELTYLIQDFKVINDHCYYRHGRGEPQVPNLKIELTVRWKPSEGIAALYERVVATWEDIRQVQDQVYATNPKFGPGSGNTLAVYLIAVKGPDCELRINWRGKHTSDLWQEQHKNFGNAAVMVDDKGRSVGVRRDDLYSFGLDFNCFL